MRENEKNIVQQIEQEVEKNIVKNSLIQNHDKLVVAVSGGPDSVCLLYVLYDLQKKFLKTYNIQYTLIVTHVNHMIREEATQERQYVENMCYQLKLPFYYLEKNIPILAKELKMSEEACGRKVRYEFFNEILEKEKAQKIVTAHNADDDVETILLNIIRGCGLKGLTGIENQFKNIIRPLITVEKKDIMEYNKLKSLNPCIDQTNFELICTRNKLRNELIPKLQTEYNSNIKKNLLRLKEITLQEEDFLEKYTLQVVQQSIIENEGDIKFYFQKILTEHLAIQRRAIRKLLSMKMKNVDGLSYVHVNDILDLLEHNIKGKKYIIGNKFTIEIIQKNIAIIY